jgi:uncharacterized protein (DUF736 family)
MDRQNKPNSGVFFSQSLKKSDNAPDYTGEVLIDIRTFKVENHMISVRLAGWKNVAKSGKSYIALKCDTPRTQTEQGGGDDFE